jgi:hypothetical protein
MNTREKYAEMLESEEHERRMKIIAQNGNSGLNYEQDMLNGFNKPTEEVVTKAADRKATPVFSGVLKYFPDAINELARCSMAGQKQHAPDEPLQWHREKSGDELDALARHLLEAGTIDDDSIRHSTKVLWRAAANLQKELELAGEAPLSKYNKI